MPWWTWLLFGLILLTLEVQTLGTFYLFFFGLGSLLVGLLVAIGVVGAAWAQWLLFTVLSLSTLFLLRRPLMARLGPVGGETNVGNLVGEIAVAQEAMPRGGRGRVELRGATWSVVNTGLSPIGAGQRCRVEGVEGLTLRVSAE